MSIKVENADPTSSTPLVFDVMSADESVTDPLATHVLKFGDFVILGTLENIKMVSAAEKAERDAEALEEQQAAEKQAAEDNKAAQEAQTQPLSAARVDYAQDEPKLKRKDLEELTKDELIAYADNHDIEVNQHWTKADIVDAIVKHR